MKYAFLTATLLAGTAAPAFAQDAAPQDDSAAPAQSGDAAAEPAEGDTIVVTAQRREQTLAGRQRFDQAIRPTG